MSTNKYLPFIFSLAMLPGALNAQGAEEPVKEVAEASRPLLEVLGVPDDPIIIALLAAIIVMFFIALYLKGTYMSLFRQLYPEKVKEAAKQEVTWKKLVVTMNEAVPVEEEHKILTDHDYDGIRELDNNLPLWWRYMFYATIVFSFVYMFRYHIFRSADLPHDEYNKELASAELMKEELRKKDAANVDETSVVVLTEADALSAGAKIFGDNCRACHGGAGEGGVGPNLTDEYWLHGGSVKDVFKSIKYGIPDKGMIAWQAQLKPKQIQDVASYIMSLKGTKPANAKAPQGEVFNEGPAAADSIPAADTVKIASN